MATKNSASTLVSGLGMGMRLLQLLVNEVVSLGGYDEMLHFLTTERDEARDAIKKIAELIVKIEWRIPRSLMERLAEEDSVNQNRTSDYVEEDKRFAWGSICDKFEIPLLVFNEHGGLEDVKLPLELERQLINKPLKYPMIVMFEGKEYILCAIGGGEMESGKTLEGGTYFGFAETRYFDLER